MGHHLRKLRNFNTGVSGLILNSLLKPVLIQLYKNNCSLRILYCIINCFTVQIRKGIAQLFLVAVHCDITVWYMTSVMGTNRSIYLFTPERPRDLSARAPGPACQEYYNTITRAQICLFWNFARRSEHLWVYLKRLPQSKEFCVLSLSTGWWVIGFLNPH